MRNWKTGRVNWTGQAESCESERERDGHAQTNARPRHPRGLRGQKEKSKHEVLALPSPTRPLRGRQNDKHALSTASPARFHTLAHLARSWRGSQHSKASPGAATSTETAWEWRKARPQEKSAPLSGCLG